MNDKFILTIFDKFNSSSIGELALSDGTYSLTLKKERTETPAEGIIPAATGVQTERSVRLGISANAVPEASGGGEVITSPIVAVLYTAPGPDAPPFVKRGSKVKAGQTLCILEAMKMMNHLEAEFNCEIIEIHAVNGELVEYGQNLFTVKQL